jgi:eukaryotic-like serine/threonine-protein kinase
LGGSVVLGEIVGSYKLVRKLGEGGMGEVYLAEHKYIARRTAIKFLLPELTSSAEVVERFFAEARATSAIDHPGIVQVIDCDVHRDGRAYIVMELLRGESLRDYLARAGTLTGDEPGVLGIFRDIAAALAAAHRQGIVHRDLKPDNIFLHLPSGRAPATPILKVLDFGIAKLLGGGGESGSQTRTGQLLGTPLYMSPEQCRGARSIDHRSDIYSLACIVYELCCGVPPYQADGFGDLILAHVSLPIPDPHASAPGMSRALRDVLVSCLAKEPNDRPPSMDALAATLAGLGGNGIVRLATPVLESERLTDLGPAASPGRSSPPSPKFSAAAVAATTPVTPAPAPPGRPVVDHQMPVVANQATTLHHGASEIIRTAAGRGSRVAVIAAAIGAAIAVAVVIARAVGGHPPTPVALSPQPSASSPPSPAPAAAPSAPAATAPSAPAATEPAAPATSSIALQGIPPGASVRLDGRPVSLPLTVPRRPEDHRLRIEAEGYAPVDLTVNGRSDRTLAVEMKKAYTPGGAEPTTAPVAKTSHKTGSHPHHSTGFHAFTDL